VKGINAFLFLNGNHTFSPTKYRADQMKQKAASVLMVSI